MNKNKKQKIISILAALFTTVAFLPKAYNVYITKSVIGLNLYTLILFLIGKILWLIDATYTRDIGLFISSILNSGVYMFLIYAKYNY